MFRSYTAVAAMSMLLGSTGLAAAALASPTTDLNLRAGPGTDYAVVGVLPDGATVNATGCGDGWCHVNYGGTSGYASAGYLAFGGGSAAVVVAPTYEYGYGYGPYDYGYDYGYAGPIYGPSINFRIGGHRRHAGNWHRGGWHHGRGDHDGHVGSWHPGRQHIGGRGNRGTRVGGSFQSGGGMSRSGTGRGGAGRGGMGRGAMARGGMGHGGGHDPATVGQGGGGGHHRR